MVESSHCTNTSATFQEYLQMGSQPYHHEFQNNILIKRRQVCLCLRTRIFSSCLLYIYQAHQSWSIVKYEVKYVSYTPLTLRNNLQLEFNIK